MKLPKTYMVYEPRGMAREYAALALNIYTYCEHGCGYCYAPGALCRKKESYFSIGNPRKDIIKKLHKDVKKLAVCSYVPEILISFIGDPYQPAEMELGLTRAALSILIENDLPFTILTKGGSRAQRDFDLLSNFPNSRFGTSLVFTNQTDATEWEPGAASIQDRIDTINVAHGMGIPTWVSMEPVIYPDQALQIIREIHPIVDHWKIGKINHNKQLEEAVDWIQFREEVAGLLESLGANYYLKNSLTAL
jgi:DNA repair photolyase